MNAEKLDDRAEVMLVTLLVSPPRDMMKAVYFTKVGELCWKQVASSVINDACSANKVC